MEHILASRRLVATINNSSRFGNHSSQLRTSEESKKLILQETLKRFEKELEAMRTDTMVAMAILSSNIDRMAALDKQIQELRKLYELNDASSAAKGGESESQPSTSRTSILDNPSLSTANNSGSSTAESISKRINDSTTVGEPRPKKPNTNDTDKSVPAERLEMLPQENAPPAVLRAAAITKGVLSPIELLSFLYLSQNVDCPVDLAKVSFTPDANLLYFQLCSLKFNLQKTRDTSEIKSRNLLEFEEKLDVLIALFKSRIK